MYTSSDTKLEWPGEGALFKSDPNKRQGAKMGPLFESPPRPLLESGLQPCLVSSRYPRQFLNNQSGRSSIVKRDGQKSVDFLPVVKNLLRPIFRPVGFGIHNLKVNISTNIQHK